MSEVGLGVVVAIGAVRALDLKVRGRFRTEVEGKTFISHFDYYWSICCSLLNICCSKLNLCFGKLKN